MKQQIPLNIPADHPAFAGHFPGTPIVPGVVLLDEVLHAISSSTGMDETSWQISSVKFLSPLTPNEAVVIEHEQMPNGTIKFQVLKIDTPDTNRQIVIGSLVGNALTKIAKVAL
jgi:3-hydroxyacyl-[acyl-carrier-protein] dehydratase